MALSAPRLIVITGGTKGGIGFEAARQLVQKGHRVICTFRDAGKAQVAMEELRGEKSVSNLPAEERVQWVKMDLASFASVREASAELIKLTKGKIDGLLCNAALAPMGAPKPYATADGFEATYQTNHLSHFLMVHLLLPSLAASTAPGGGRIGVVTSELHKSLGKTPADPEYLETILKKPDTEFRRLEVYSLSKLLNLWFTFKLAKLLEQAQVPVTVDAVTPGWVPSSNLGHGNGITWIQTFLMQKLLPLMPGTVSMKAAADRFVQVMVGQEAMVGEGKFGNGRYFSDHKPNPGSEEARNTAKADRLWELSLKATGIPADAYLPK